MGRTSIALAVLAVFVAAIVPAMAAQPAKKAPAKPAAHKKVVSATCPVMSTTIPDVSKAAGGKSVYKGKTYYFCCAGCKPMFDKDPEKYIKAMEAAKKKEQAKKQPAKKK
jgi:YHS domain-containing protein